MSDYAAIRAYRVAETGKAVLLSPTPQATEEDIRDGDASWFPSSQVLVDSEMKRGEQTLITGRVPLWLLGKKTNLSEAFFMACFGCEREELHPDEDDPWFEEEVGF